MKIIIKPSVRRLSSIILVLHSIGVFANGITPKYMPNAKLINEGRKLFFEETFDENGRTCKTISLHTTFKPTLLTY